MPAYFDELASALDCLSDNPLDCFDTADWNFEVELKKLSA